MQGVTFEQHGFMEQAISSYELGMSKLEGEMLINPVPVSRNSELKLWEAHWIRSLIHGCSFYLGYTSHGLFLALTFHDFTLHQII